MEKFPNVELIDLEGESSTLNTLIKQDKLNLVLFYNTNCLGCTGRAIPLAYDLSKEFEFLNLIIIHSSFRPQPFEKEEILSVFVNQKSPFNIHKEAKHELYSHFDCDGTPHWLIIDGQGEVAHSIFGSMDGAQMKLGYAIQEYADELQ